MSAQVDQPLPPMDVKRSGSISLLRGRAGSFRRKEGPKRNTSRLAREIPRVPSRLAAPALEDDARSGGRPSYEVDPTISYAVSITAGNLAEKPKEKRRVFSRMLHKKSAPRAAQLPNISENRSESRQSEWKAPANPSSRPHVRSSSALSFFSSNETAIHNGKGYKDEVSPWSSVQALHANHRASPEPQKSSPMSKYNANQTLPRQPSLAPEPSKGNASSGKPHLKLKTRPEDLLSRGILTRSASLASRPPYPPRKSSLQDNTAIEGSVHVETSKAELLHSIESSAVHRRKRSDELVPLIHLDKSPLERSPPEPPPKDTAKEYTTHPQSFQDSQSLDLISVEPLDRFSVMFKDVLGFRASPTSTAYKPDTLPSPRLSKPRQSTLATRRQAAPKMLQIMAKGHKKNKVRHFVGAVISPVPASRGAVPPKISSQSPLSPAIGKAISTDVPESRIIEAAAFAITVAPPSVHKVPQVPNRAAPPPPTDDNERNKIQSLVLPIQLPDSMPAQSKETAAATITDSRSTGTVPSRQMKSPSRLKSPAAPPPPAKSTRRRSMTYSGHHGFSGSGQRPVRKSLHRRKPTGFRPVNYEIRRGRAADRVSVGSIPPEKATDEQVSSQSTGHRRSQSPQGHKLPARLTPPRLQGEWSSENSNSGRGRRHPSPLRNASTDAQDKTPESTLNLASQVRPVDSSGGSSEDNNKEKVSPSHTAVRAKVTESSLIEHHQHNMPVEFLSKKKRMGKFIKGPSHIRAPSHTAMLPLAMHPFPAAAAGAADSADPSGAHDANARVNDPLVLAQGRQVLVGAGHKVTAEESIQRMMDKQREQQEALRARFLGSTGRPSEATVGTI